MRSSPTYAKHHVGKLDSLAVLLILARKKNYLGNYLQCVEGPRKKNCRSTVLKEIQDNLSENSFIYMIREVH